MQPPRGPLRQAQGRRSGGVQQRRVVAMGGAHPQAPAGVLAEAPDGLLAERPAADTAVNGPAA
jgi:hypothetical protein